MNISKYFENTDKLFDGLEDMSLESVVATMENAAMFLRDTFENDMAECLETAIYPRYGYTTGQIIKNEEEYTQFLTEDFEERLAEWLNTACDYAIANDENDNNAKEIKMNNEQTLQNKINKNINEQPNTPNAARTMYFNYDVDSKTWCFTGETIGGLLWETDNMEAESREDAMLQAIAYLGTFDL
jgi:hypothetical protein